MSKALVLEAAALALSATSALADGSEEVAPAVPAPAPPQAYVAPPVYAAPVYTVPRVYVVPAPVYDQVASFAILVLLPDDNCVRLAP
jgi:hypothetical protein